MSSLNNIPNGWEETTLGSLIKVGRGSSPRPIHNYLAEKGIPWVKIADATASSNKYIEKTKQFIIEEGRSTSVKPGDLIVSNSATPGIPKIMAINACVHDGWLVFDEYKNIDKLYLYYFFLFFRKKLNHSASGSVFKNLKTEIVRNINLLLPKNIEEQKAMAKILAVFDDKIENLQAQNKTLEQTAQTTFKEWFGKYQLGDELPEGWEIGKLGDFKATIVDFVANGSFASLKENVTLYEEPEYALFIRNTDLKSNFKEKKYVDKKSYEFLSKSKLFGGEIIISNVGDVGSVHFCPHFDMPMTLGNNVIMLKSDFQLYFYTFFNSRIGQHLIGTITGGSAQPKFNKTDFRNMGMVIPPRSKLRQFEEFSSSLYHKLLENKAQVQSLKKTRDTLLPKLMSGQIRVNDFKD